METFSDYVSIIKYQVIPRRSDWKPFTDKNKKQYILIRMRVKNDNWAIYYINQINYDNDIDNLRKNKIPKWSKCKIDIICIPSATRFSQDHNKYIKKIELI